MGVYRAAIVTENGQNLIAQALANEKPLIFTSAKTSSYSYPVGTNVPALTGLQDVVQSVMPFDSKVLGGNVAQVSVRFDNDGVDQTYRIETIGLYAKIEGGTETLFSVTQATTPDEMPVQSDVSPSAYIYNIQHTVQNASQITLTVNPAGTATVQDIMDIESPEFDDSGTVEGISSFPSFLETMKSKMNFFQFFRNLKAGLQFVLHAGQIVNNCVTDNSSLPLSAAQGKVLKDLYTQLYSDMSNYRAIIVNDTPADDIPSLLKAKAKLISNQNKGDGFYVIIGGWQGKTYGFSIGNVIGGKITIACFLNNNCYLATCDYSNPESNFSYATMKPDLSPYITKSQLFAAQSQSFLVNKSTTIDGTLFSTANFKAQRPNNGTGAASYGFENIGINSGALYLDPTDYKLHFINYEGKDFTINWTKN